MKLLVKTSMHNLPVESKIAREIANVSEGFCILAADHNFDQGRLTLNEYGWLECSRGFLFKIVDDDYHCDDTVIRYTPPVLSW